MQMIFRYVRCEVESNGNHLPDSGVNSHVGMLLANQVTENG